MAKEFNSLFIADMDEKPQVNSDVDAQNDLSTDFTRMVQAAERGDYSTITRIFIENMNLETFNPYQSNSDEFLDRENQAVHQEQSLQLN